MRSQILFLQNIRNKKSTAPWKIKVNSERKAIMILISALSLSLKRNYCTGCFADKPLLVCPIAKNLGPMQLYMFAIRIKGRNRAIFAERAAAAEGAGLIRSTSAIINIRGTKAAKRALHRLGSERRLLGQIPYSGHRRDSPNFEIARRSNVRLASRNINEMQQPPK